MGADHALTRPHLLYIAWGFPPSRGGGVYRALATANQAARAGFRVTVLTATVSSFEQYTGVDQSLLAAVDDGITIERVPFRSRAREVSVHGDGSLRDLAARSYRKALAQIGRLPFPETHYGQWRGPLTRAAFAVHRRDPVDLVLATANPYVTFAAAAALRRRHGVPYVVDYRDAWTLDVFSGDTVHQRYSREARWEQRMLRGAAEAWFVNEPIYEWHRARYSDLDTRMRVVRNGWDPELLGEVPTPEVNAPPHPLVYGYLGTITRKVPVEELVAGWTLARDQLPTGSRLILAGHHGYFARPDPDVARFLDSARAAGVEIRGPVPKLEVGSYYAELDVLVLALGTGRYVTSGKVYEYTTAARPIVAVHDPATHASEVIAGYPGAEQASSTHPADIASAIVAAATAHERTTSADVSARLAIADSLRRDKVLKDALQDLRTLVSHVRPVG